jgi:hypothetical protein
VFRVNIISVFLIALTCQILLSGCATTSNDRSDAKSWLTESIPLEKFMDVNLDDGIPDKFVFLVPESTEANAEVMLRHSSCIKLSRQKVSELLLEDVNMDEGYYPFLVRGVATRERSVTGRFQCCLAEKLLWVEYSEMGHKQKPPSKQAVILFLKEKPHSVFVTYSIIY